MVEKLKKGKKGNKKDKWFEETVELPPWLSTDASKYRTSFNDRNGRLIIAIPGVPGRLSQVAAQVAPSAARSLPAYTVVVPSSYSSPSNYYDNEQDDDESSFDIDDDNGFSFGANIVMLGLAVVRSSTFVAEKLGNLALAKDIVVPVVGGHSGVTIVPLLSQSSHSLPSNLSSGDYDALVNRIQFGGDEVVKAKDGAGSATLSMAYAGAEFATKVLRAVKGEKGLVAPTYVSLAADPQGAALLTKELGAEVAYFSSNVELGPEGVVRIHPLGKISETEQNLVKAAIPELTKNIAAGVSFVTEARL